MDDAPGDREAGKGGSDAGPEVLGWRREGAHRGEGGRGQGLVRCRSRGTRLEEGGGMDGAPAGGGQGGFLSDGIVHAGPHAGEEPACRGGAIRTKTI